ncbi:MAG TPA: DUF58 domain-containing protein [Candidatus Eisenbacteria bacterium]|nr:DUF58 domain-containing protein [Candidatus Eisenbacteria bacterium]
MLDLVLFRIYRLFSGGRYWFRRRFTQAGLGVLCALLVAAMMGPYTENNVAYQAFTLLLCMLTVSAIFIWGFRVSFSIQRLLPRFGTAGTPLTYAVLIRNLTAKRQDGLTLIEDFNEHRPSFREWQAVKIDQRKQLRSFRFSGGYRTAAFRALPMKEAIVPALAPQEEVQVRYEFTPLRRGILRFKGVSVARLDPLGLLRALVRLPVPQTALILPRRYSLPPIAFPGTLKYQDGGVALASHVGQSEEFVALRDYRHGDPLRHIHWRSWAKTGKPVVKEFEDEFFVRHALVLDTFIDSPHSELFEEAVSVAASFACAVQTQESLLDLLFVGAESYCFTAGRGVAHTDQMLEILASVRPCAEQSFSSLEDLVLNHVSVVSGCICVLLAWDKPRQDFVERLKSMGVPPLVLVIRGRGQTQPLDPGPMWDEPERFKVLQLGRIQEDLAKLR